MHVVGCERRQQGARACARRRRAPVYTLCTPPPVAPPRLCNTNGVAATHLLCMHAQPKRGFSQSGGVGGGRDCNKDNIATLVSEPPRAPLESTSAAPAHTRRYCCHRSPVKRISGRWKRRSVAPGPVYTPCTPPHTQQVSAPPRAPNTGSKALPHTHRCIARRKRSVAD
jgi:hypothetical protein